MQQEYVYPFLAPATIVWERELGERLTLTKAALVSPPHPTHKITVTIGITGHLRGSLIYQFDQDTAVAIASRMIGEPLPSLNELGFSALAELANMMSGNAATIAAQFGYVCDISPPAMLVPTANVTLKLHGGGTHLLANHASPLGELAVRVSLVEAA